MESDAIEARIALYANFPRVTHKVVCDGKVIGRVWSNGAIEIDDTEPQAAHQERARPEGEATP